MPKRTLPLLLCLLLLGCPGGGSEGDGPEGAAEESEARTRQQRDSALAESRLPGAGAVGRALDAAGTAEERRARMDSLQP